MLEQAPRLGPTVLPFAQRTLKRSQAPIHLPRTHRAQTRHDITRQAPPPGRPRQPPRQQRPQADRPRIPCRFPDAAQRPHHQRAVLQATAATPAPRALRPPDEPDHRFPVIARHLTHLVQQLTPRRAAGDHIPLAHPRQILSSRLWSHPGCSHEAVLFHR